MAHFAKLDENNIVTQVVVISNEHTADKSGVEKEYIGKAYCERLFGGNWVQTSYNNNFRKRYAGVGMRYDEDLDVFIDYKPYNSWVLDGNGDWQAPVALPEDSGTGDPPKQYTWNEETQQWDVFTPPPDPSPE